MPNWHCHIMEAIFYLYFIRCRTVKYVQHVAYIVIVFVYLTNKTYCII